MRKRQREDLIGRTIVESTILAMVSIFYLWAFSAYENVKLILWAPHISAIMSILVFAGGAFAGYIAYKKKIRFYYRYVFYAMVMSGLGFYAAYSMYTRTFYYIWLFILLIILSSIVYTTYMVNKKSK